MIINIQITNSTGKSILPIINPATAANTKLPVHYLDHNIIILFLEQPAHSV